MNEQILKDLAEQAGFDVERLYAPYPGGFPREDMLALDSFAELIIQECIEVMVKNDYHGEWLGEKVKEHFGVDE